MFPCIHRPSLPGSDLMSSCISILGQLSNGSSWCLFCFPLMLACFPLMKIASGIFLIQKSVHLSEVPYEFQTKFDSFKWPLRPLLTQCLLLLSLIYNYSLDLSSEPWVYHLSPISKPLLVLFPLLSPLPFTWPVSALPSDLCVCHCPGQILLPLKPG
jgi:hypothetical protein